jgi:pilus assembly protein CpaE
MDTARGIAEKYRGLRPTLGVLLLRRRIDMQILTDALRSGIREVIAADDSAALLDAANRSRGISAQLGDGNVRSTRHGKIILVFAAKGGCGKTTIATNLAVSLADLVKVPVCLVDFDLEFGDVAVAMQIDPTKTISDAVPMAATLDRQGLTPLLMSRNENFDILLAPRLPADSDDITPELAERVLSILAETYSYVIVDSPPAFTDVILKTFDIADEHILITTLDMPAVKNLQVTLDTLDTLGYDRTKRHVIINRSTSDSGLSVRDVAGLVNAEIVATIPSTGEVSAAVNRGKTLVEERPRGKFASSMRRLAQRVVAEEAEKDTVRRGGFFRRTK